MLRGSLCVCVQGPGQCQLSVSSILGLPNNKINITNRRTGVYPVCVSACVYASVRVFLCCCVHPPPVLMSAVWAGGGYGGKGTRQLPLVASAALGAYVTGMQVHVILERCQDLIMVRLRVYLPYVWLLCVCARVFAVCARVLCLGWDAVLDFCVFSMRLPAACPVFLDVVLMCGCVCLPASVCVQTGGREDLVANYEVGVDAKGVIQGMMVTWYVNGGSESPSPHAHAPHAMPVVDVTVCVSCGPLHRTALVILAATSM